MLDNIGRNWTQEDNFSLQHIIMIGTYVWGEISKIVFSTNIDIQIDRKNNFNIETD